MTPKISVVTAVYNGALYLNQTIESVLSQTETDFEFILVDDQSTDNSIEIVKSFNDPRIRLLRNLKNEGIVATRNKAIQAATGKYVALIDQDDVALPSRFSKQAVALDQNEKLGLIGSWVNNVNSKGKPLAGGLRRQYSRTDWALSLLFFNSFTNSSIMCRKIVIQDPPYSREFQLCEDYYFIYMIAKKWEIDMLYEPLTEYRMHESNFSKVRKDLMTEYELKFKKLALEEKLQITVTDLEVVAHQLLHEREKPMTLAEFNRSKDWLSKILSSSSESMRSIGSSQVLLDVVWEFYRANCHLGLLCFTEYARQSRNFNLPIRSNNALRLTYKCLKSYLKG
jgi:glycosyltransferase involved in cell wall biosynthesis